MNKQIFVATLALLLSNPAVASATTNIEQAINKYHIAFPIPELGNCTDFDTCRAYCANSNNHSVCVSYAQNKGFYKQAEIDEKKEEILDKAQDVLGCNTVSSCKSLCENEANFERCTEFAKSNGLGGGKILSPKNTEILSKAKSILGCDSPSSCKALCDNQDNRDRCKNFMQSAGLQVKDGADGGPKEGPGGCNSEESCKAYCAAPAHREECKQSGPGPGGEQEPEPPCQGDDECRIFCIEHPAECPGFQAPANLPGEELCPSGQDCSGILDPEKGYNPASGQFDAPPTPPTNPAVQGASTSFSIFDQVWLLFRQLLNPPTRLNKY